MRWVKGEGWVERTCVICGASFQVRRNLTKRNPCIYCSTTCMGAGNRGPHSSFAPHDTLRGLYVEDGLTLEQIGNRYGVTKQAVRHQLERAGVARRPSSRDPQWLSTPEVRAKIAAATPRGEQHHNWRAVPAAQVAEWYASGLSADIIGQRLGVSMGTVIRSLESSGIPRRAAGFPRYRTASDGHRVQSALELLIDNWLADHNIPHKSRPALPFSKTQRADWLARDRYIELWGVTGNVAYARRREAKIAQYAAHGLSLIEVWPDQVMHEDFAPLKVLL